MRMGWNQTRTISESIFTRADDHPIDGAAVGMSDGLAVPVFPPALDTDLTLYLYLWLAGTPGISAIRANASRNPLDVTGAFALSGALTVGSVAGTVYVSSARLSSMTGTAYDVLIAGARIATIPDIEAHTADPDAHHAPPPTTGGGGRVELFKDTADYTRSNTSTVYRQMSLSRAPARGGGLETGYHERGPQFDGTAVRRDNGRLA